MKKFHFSLDSVKNFKEQELEELKRLHGLAAAALREKEEEITRLEAERDSEVALFDEKKAQGVRVPEARNFDAHLRRLQKNLEHEYKQRELLRIEEEECRDKVVEKKKETASLEKLREKRVAEYDKAVQKEEESFIEEIVLNKRAASM